MLVAVFHSRPRQWRSMKTGPQASRPRPASKPSEEGTENAEFYPLSRNRQGDPARPIGRSYEHRPTTHLFAEGAGERGALSAVTQSQGDQDRSAGRTNIVRRRIYPRRARENAELYPLSRNFQGDPQVARHRLTPHLSAEHAESAESAELSPCRNGRARSPWGTMRTGPQVASTYLTKNRGIVYKLSAEGAKNGEPPFLA